MMNDLHMKMQSYCNVTCYEIIINALQDLFVHNNDVTHVSLWVVFFIVVTLISLIILFKRKHDEIFSFPNDILPLPNEEHVEIQYSRGNSKFVNYKRLLEQLHYVTSKCHDNRYASKCIRLVRDCPYLINVTLEPSGLTPFQRVCYNGHTCLVEYMLAKGGNPWLMTQAGENALCLAVYYYIKHPQNKDLSCLDVLLQSGCTLDPMSRWFDIVLKMATQVCHKRLVEWILVHANASTYDQRSMSVPAAFHNMKSYSHRYKPLFQR